MKNEYGQYGLESNIRFSVSKPWLDMYGEYVRGVSVLEDQ